MSARHIVSVFFLEITYYSSISSTSTYCSSTFTITFITTKVGIKHIIKNPGKTQFYHFCIRVISVIGKKIGKTFSTRSCLSTLQNILVVADLTWYQSFIHRFLPNTHYITHTPQQDKHKRVGKSVTCVICA